MQHVCIKLTYRLQLSGDFQQLVLHLDADFFALKATKKQICFFPRGLKR